MIRDQILGKRRTEEAGLTKQRHPSNGPTLLRTYRDTFLVAASTGGGAIFALPSYDGMLRRVIYISRSMIGADPNQLEAIISTSIHRNAPFELTGMLWADGRSFAQVIEGDPHHLEQAMDRIRKDRRHKDLEVLLDRFVSSRQFGNWSMRQAVDDEANAQATTFMIGFAMGQRTNAAKRLYEIILGSERH